MDTTGLILILICKKLDRYGQKKFLFVNIQLRDILLSYTNNGKIELVFFRYGVHP